MPLDPSAPVAIGGVGGSGTRVVAEMLVRLGYHIGTDNNSAYDNLWFRFLLKRPAWYARVRAEAPEQVDVGLAAFTKIMTGSAALTAGERRFVRSAVREQGWRGVKRGIKLLRRRRLERECYIGWGWKEPNTYIFLDRLAAHYPRLKYIHTIRHGLDMAFSETLGQLGQWGPLLGLDPPATGWPAPEQFLEFWIRANRHALEKGRELDASTFYLLDFNALCADPKSETNRLIEFLGLQVPAHVAARLARIPRTPTSTGRYREHDTSVFTAEQLRAVEELGFTMEQASD